MATALAAGAEIHLVPERLMAEPEALGAMIRHRAIDLIELPATIARQLPQRADMAPRTLVIGGEVCPRTCCPIGAGNAASSILRAERSHRCRNRRRGA